MAASRRWSSWALRLLGGQLRLPISQSRRDRRGRRAAQLMSRQVFILPCIASLSTSAFATGSYAKTVGERGKRARPCCAIANVLTNGRSCRQRFVGARNAVKGCQPIDRLEFGGRQNAESGERPIASVKSILTRAADALLANPVADAIGGPKMQLYSFAIGRLLLGWFFSCGLRSRSFASFVLGFGVISFVAYFCRNQHSLAGVARRPWRRGARQRAISARDSGDAISRRRGLAFSIIVAWCWRSRAASGRLCRSGPDGP